MKTQFETAAQNVQKLSMRPENETLLKLYAYYKQATSGDLSGKRPGLTDLTGRAKFDAWAKQKGVAKDAAVQAYIELADSLLNR